MTPRDILAVTVLVFGTLMGASIIVASSQGRGIDDSATWAIGAGIAVAVAGALGVVLDTSLRRRKGSDAPAEPVEPPEPPTP